MTKEDDMNAKEKFIDAVYKLMRDKGCKTNADFCELVGIDTTRFSRLMKPTDSASPKASELLAISETCNVTIDSLFGLERKTDTESTLQDLLSLPGLFNLITTLEQHGAIRLEHSQKRLYPTVGEHSSGQANEISIIFNYTDLQEALYKWVNYNEKFADEKNDDYIKSMLELLRMGLVQKLKECENGSLEIPEEGLPFN